MIKKDGAPTFLAFTSLDELWSMVNSTTEGDIYVR
jgi:hypothetical protein